MAISQNFPTTRPSLNLNFSRARKLDSRVTFTRGSTGTYVDESGLIRTAGINEARFDYDPISGESLGLLVEESRTNLLQYSQALATSPWGIYNGGGFSVSNNITTSPDGTSNASQINCTSWTSGDSVYQDASVSGTGTYTISIFVKGNSCNAISFVAFLTGNSTESFSLNYNPLTGQITGTSGGSNHTVVSYPNGWYRIYLTGTGTNALNNTLRFQVYTNTTGITYLWGAQLEAGAFPTSYIPTVASTVTRSADNASITGTNLTDWYNQPEGTYITSARYDGTPIVGSTNRAVFTGYAGSNAFYWNVWWDGSNTAAFVVEDPPGTYHAVLTSGATLSIGQTRKTASVYKSNDYAFTTNGATPSTDTSGSISSTVTVVYIGNLAGSVWYLNGRISQLTYYPVRLTNTQLQTLTK